VCRCFTLRHKDAALKRDRFVVAGDARFGWSGARLWEAAVMDVVRIRQAGPGDALLIAALTIQAARAEGLIPDKGFLDRYAETWLENRATHPAWWAEAGGEHAGLLIATRTRPLPWPGRTGGGSVHLERLFVRADQPIDRVANALRAAAREWAAARGITEVELG
jgi:hypothetical protein